MLIPLLLLFCCISCQSPSVYSWSLTNENATIIENANDTQFSNVPPSVLTATELEGFTRSIKLIQDVKCRHDLNETLWGILSGKPWALAIYDSTAKAAFGLQLSVLHHFGHFDECLEQKKFLNPNSEIPVRAKYCLADVTLNDIRVLDVDSRKRKPMNKTIAAWGACVPITCNGNDTKFYLENLLQRPVAIDESKCQVFEEKINVTTAMFFYAVIIFFFIFLTGLSTAYHVYLIYTTDQSEGLTKKALKNQTLNTALLAFSVIENTKKLFQTSKDTMGLNSLNGLKTMAMLFILQGHALSFFYGQPAYNTGYITEHLRSLQYAFLTNSFLFVDTFLLLSGFLFCRILLIELERRRGRVNMFILYIARYIRLTPAYMAVIGFYMTWFPTIDSGPLWRERIEREQERCQASWWLNILYINNYINSDKLCMFQSWYLSVDSQLFCIASIVIYLLYKFRKYGFYLLTILSLVTSIIPFVITYVYELDPTLMGYQDEFNDLGSNVFYIGSYIKTHMRASAYVIGLLTGFLVHIILEKGIKLPSLLVRPIWLISFTIGFISMHSVVEFYKMPHSNIENALYAGFHKIGWNLSIAWLVFALTTGHAGWLQRVLSSQFFVPFSRLTYCAYLSNGLIEMYHSSNLRSISYISFPTMFNEAHIHILDTLILAFVLCLLFESPIHALERILLRNVGAKKQSVSSEATEQTDSRTNSSLEEQKV